MCIRDRAIGAGHSTFAMLSSFANCIVFRVVLSLLFNHLWGIYGLYAACALSLIHISARVRCTRPCAGAQSFENIEPCKTAAGAVLLRPLRGVMV